MPLSRAFQVLQEDPSIFEFGITTQMNDRQPLVLIPRSDFEIFSSSVIRPEEDDHRRHIDTPARLVVVKAIFERSERRWQFIWDGIRISAPIRDSSFFDRLAAREFEFGQGDVLEATLRVYQVRDEMSGAYINERYEVIAVHGHIPTPKQPRLIR